MWLRPGKLCLISLVGSARSLITVACSRKIVHTRKEFLEQLQGQYGLKAAAADWVLNSVISMGMSLNPDAKAVDNLRTNFEQQGGRVL